MCCLIVGLQFSNGTVRLLAARSNIAQSLTNNENPSYNPAAATIYTVHLVTVPHCCTSHSGFYHGASFPYCSLWIVTPYLESTRYFESPFLFFALFDFTPPLRKILNPSARRALLLRLVQHFSTLHYKNRLSLSRSQRRQWQQVTHCSLSVVYMSLDLIARYGSATLTTIFIFTSYAFDLLEKITVLLIRQLFYH